VRARLYLLATAILFSTGGAAVKACGLGSWQVAGLRSAIAVAALLIAVPSTRARWTLPVLVVGGSQALTMISFVTATKLTSAANAIFLQSTAPLYVVLLAPILLREPVRRSDVAFLAAFVVGLGTIFLGDRSPTATAPNPALGNWIAAASGVAWAFTVIGFRWTARDPASFGAALLAGNVIVALVALPLGWPITGATPADWAIVAFLGVVQIGLAYALLSIGMREVPALEASLLMLLEPVLNPLWTWIVHGERVGPASLVGGGIVLAATAARTWANAPGRGAVVATNRFRA
jgi:drug/metabolite transporter (DMT)-like permease